MPNLECRLYSVRRRGLRRSIGGITTSIGFEILVVVEVLAAGDVSCGVEVVAGYIVLGAAICSLQGRG